MNGARFQSASRPSTSASDAPRIRNKLRIAFGGKFNAIVDTAQQDGDADRIDRQFLLEPLIIAQSPGVSRLAAIAFDPDLVLVDQDVFSKRLDGSVVLEFNASIVLL